MKKRTIIVHGSRATLDGLMNAISTDAVSWDVYRNGRKVFSSPGPDAAIDYVADESAMNKHTIQMEAMGGSKLIDDGQIAWQIKKSGSAQDSDLFTPSMLEELRREYSQIRSVDPAGEAYQKLTGFLNKMSQPQLRQLAGANIPFLSRLARNRVISKDHCGDLSVHIDGDSKKPVKDAEVYKNGAVIRRDGKSYRIGQTVRFGSGRNRKQMKIENFGEKHESIIVSGPTWALQPNGDLVEENQQWEFVSNLD